MKKHYLNFPWFSPLGFWSFQASWFPRGNQEFSFINTKMNWGKEGLCWPCQTDPLCASCKLTGTDFHHTLCGMEAKPSSCQSQFPVVFSSVGLISFLPFVMAGNMFLASHTRAKAMATAMFCWNNQLDTLLLNFVVTINFRRKVVPLPKISLMTECLCLSVETDKKTERIFPCKCKHNWM